jgi:6-phosphogluconolactonase (cycloisomerase 2 family)
MPRAGGRERVRGMLPRLLFMICGLALLAAAPAQAMPAGAVTVSGKAADCAGGRGAPCKVVVRGLMNPVTGVFSDDGRNFYVGSLGNGGVISFARDTAGGRLTPVQGGAACIGFQLGCERSAHPMPHALAITHDGRFLYAGGAGAEDGLLAFTRDAATGALTPAGCLRGYRDACAYPGGSGDGGIRALEVSPDDRFLMSATGTGVGVVNRDPATGALSQTPGNCVIGEDRYNSYDEPSKGCRVDERIGQPVEMDLSPDGATLYVAAEEGERGSGGLLVFARDAATGQITLSQRVGEGFYEVQVSPDGRSVYAVTEEFDVHAFARDPATGALTRIAGKRGCFAYAKGCAPLKGVSAPEDVRVSPDGRYVYFAAAEGVSVLRRAADGGLSQMKRKAACNVMRDKLDLPSIARQCHHGRYELPGLTGFEVAPGGRHLYALESGYDHGYGTGVVQLMQRH